jgi:hypothetical protein
MRRSGWHATDRGHRCGVPALHRGAFSLTTGGILPPGRRRELRHTFVSLLSAHGVPVEAIALLAGYQQTATTELVYRHQIVPALTRGAEVMDQIFR